MATPKDPPAPDALTLRFDLPPLPLERINLPAPYDAHHAMVQLDVPAKELDQLTGVSVLARVVVEWSLRLPDGSPAPTTEEAFTALWDQAPPLAMWLVDTYYARRLHPLVALSTRKNGSSLQPTTT